jgi:hypothetical protein
MSLTSIIDKRTELIVVGDKEVCKPIEDEDTDCERES